MFGKNEFGDPHFKIVWGQSQFIKQGNLWRDKHGNERPGYRMRYQCHAMPCWVIMRWKSPVTYGSPDSYYANTWMAAKSQMENDPEHPHDSPDGFYILAEYPWRGRYEIVQPLISKEFIDNELKITHFPLSHYLIDTIIPMLLAFQQLSEEEKAASREFAKQEEHKKEVAKIEEILTENLPRWWGPVSYGAQGCRTSVLDRKMQQIQQVWDRLSKRGRRPVFNRGLAIGTKPVPRY